MLFEKKNNSANVLFALNWLNSNQNVKIRTEKSYLSRLIDNILTHLNANWWTNNLNDSMKLGFILHFYHKLYLLRTKWQKCPKNVKETFFQFNVYFKSKGKQTVLIASSCIVYCYSCFDNLIIVLFLYPKNPIKQSKF